MIVAQTLCIVSHVTIDGDGTAYGAGDVYASRVGTHDDVFPGVYQNAVDAVAMQHSAGRFVGVEQHRADALSVASHLKDTLAINTHQHRLVVIGADAADGVLWLCVACECHKLVGGNASGRVQR